MRPTTTQAEALPLIDALLHRRFDGELPGLSSDGMLLDHRAHLRALPLADVLPLHGRALFAPTSLTDKQREHAAWAREDFFGELGAAVGVSDRVLLAAVRARTFPLIPPRPIAGHEYLGAFTSEGKLEIADPCRLHKPSRYPGMFDLSHVTAAQPGRWHAFVRNGKGDEADRTAELVAIHDSGFAVVAAEQIAKVGVDAGMVGVFDLACARPEMTELSVEGIVDGLGAVARSGFGDGWYPVFAGRDDRRLIVKVRVSFLAERPEIDETIPARPSRRYAISTVFETGDIVDHPKFGTGSVLRAFEGKIDVEFADGPRTLVHAKR